VLLIGAGTADREWVQHEILKSWNRGNGFVGIRIHNLKDQDQKTDTAGRNPLDDFELPDGTILSSVCKTYDWVIDNGGKTLGKWADDGSDLQTGLWVIGARICKRQRTERRLTPACRPS
jgi:hypothetical protein